ETVGFERHVVLRLANRHGRKAGQQRRERAFMSRIEVLHEHKGHARFAGQRLEQLRHRLQAACRGANPDDGKRAPAEPLRRQGRALGSFIRGPIDPGTVEWWLGSHGSVASGYWDQTALLSPSPAACQTKNAARSPGAPSGTVPVTE